MPRIFLRDAEWRLFRLLEESLAIDIAAFAAAIEQAILDERKHPLTIAASRIEAASFETPVERGETPAPTIEF